MTNSPHSESEESTTPHASDARLTPVVVETVVRGNTTQSANGTTSNLEHSSEGRAKALAVIVLPMLVVAMIVAAFWGFAMGKVDSENDQHSRPATPATENTLPK